MSVYANFTYTLGKLAWWLLLPLLVGMILGYLLRSCMRGGRGAVSASSSTDLAASRSLVGKHEARIGELQAGHAKDADLIASLRGKITSLESAPAKTVEKIVDRPVEKLVDNPAHLSRISALEAEVAGIALLRSKLSAAESEAAKVATLQGQVHTLSSAAPQVVEKIVTVEKIVDRPVEKIVTVEKIVDRPVEKIVTVEKIVDRPVEKIVTVEKIVDRPVDRIVEKLVDNPAHLNRIAALEAEVGQIAGMQARIHAFESAPPRTVEKLVTVEKVIEKPIEKIVTIEKIVEKQIDNPVHLARIRELEAELVRARAAAVPVFDGEKAKLALGSTVKLDDLKVIEGIGPKIEELLHADGIMTWRQLSQTDPARIRGILDAAGPAYRIAEPATWPRQAGLCADGKWAELKVLMDELDGGRPA
jgi:predicted flap endonuclease-1-like 5' DNA nuclease